MSNSSLEFRQLHSTDVAEAAAVILKARFGSEFERSLYPDVYGALPDGATELPSVDFDKLLEDHIEHGRNRLARSTIRIWVATVQIGKSPVIEKIVGTITWELKY